MLYSGKTALDENFTYLVHIFDTIRKCSVVANNVVNYCVLVVENTLEKNSEETQKVMNGTKEKELMTEVKRCKERNIKVDREWDYRLKKVKIKYSSHPDWFVYGLF